MANLYCLNTPHITSMIYFCILNQCNYPHNKTTWNGKTFDCFYDNEQQAQAVRTTLKKIPLCRGFL